MKYPKTSWAMLLVLLVGFTGNAFAEDVPTEPGKRPITAGLGVVWRDQPYKDFSDSDKFKPVPLVLWEGKKFFMRANKFGYKLLDTSAWEIAPIIDLAGDGYESDSSDALDGMNDRDPWIGAGAMVTWQPSNVGVRLTATGDIADNSGGGRVNTQAFYKNRAGAWFFGTAAGFEYVSEGYNDYYYGVERSEAIPMVRPEYTPDDGYNVFVNASVFYQRPSSKWMYIGFAKYTFYDDAVDDSPITEEDKMLTIGVGVAYSFGK